MRILILHTMRPESGQIGLGQIGPNWKNGNDLTIF